MENKVVRYARVELRADDKEKREVKGLAAVFNQVADMGWFDEKIDEHAFDKCDMSDVVLNFNHNDSALLAGTRNKSLKLKVTNDGLEQESSIIDTTTGDDVLKLVRSGLIDKMSFAFEIDRDGGQEWLINEGDEKEHRTIKKIKKLYDVSLVTFPAYEGTSVSARNKELIDDLANEHLVERQKEGNTSMEKRDGVVDEEPKVVENEGTENNEETNAPAANAEPVTDNTDPNAEPEAENNDAQQPVASTDEESEEERANAQTNQKENRQMGKENQLSLDNTVSANAVENRAAANDPRDTKEVRQAYQNVCLGKITMAEYRTLFSTTEGMPIPTYLDKKVQTAWEKADTFIKRVVKTEIRGILAIPVEKDADDAVVHTEGAEAPNEEQLTLGQVMLQPASVKKWISYSDILAAMTPEEFMDYLVDELIYRVYKKANNGIIVGATDTEGNGIVGIANADLTIKITSALDFNVFNRAAAEIEDDGETIVVMNKKSFMDNYLGLTDLQGKPIFTVQNDNAGKPRYFANGLPVEFCSALPTYDAATAGQVWAVVGDFSGYRLNLPFGQNVTVIKDIVTQAKENKEALVAKLIAAGNVYKLKKFVALKLPASA